MDASSDPRMAELLAHSRWIEALAMRLVCDRSSADDVVQSTWLAALRTSSRPRGNVKGWLARIAGNVARETHRRESQRADVERSAARDERLPSSDELAARAEAESKLVAAVLSLEEPHREVLLLRYFEGLRPEEIARRSGVPASSVSKQLTRAHARLRSRLEERGISLLAVLAPIVGREPAASSIALPLIAMSTAIKVFLCAAVVAVALMLWYHSSDERVARVPEAKPPVVVERDNRSAAGALDLSKSDTAERASAVESPVAPPASGATPAPSETPEAAAAVDPTTGRIFGRVLRPDGSGAAGRRIRLIRTPGGPSKTVNADGEGRFDARELPPGDWSITSSCSKEELALVGLPADTIDMETMSQRMVDLKAGAEIEIELGTPPAKPIRVSGKIHTDSLPSSKILLQWIPDGEDGFDRAIFKRAALDGSYEVVLAEPGPYNVSMIVSASPRIERMVDVPSGAEFTQDFELSSGVVRGTVRTAAGEPVAKAYVEMTLRAGHRPMTFMSSIAFSRMTDAEGKFAFDRLDAARYAIGVHGGASANGEKTGAASVRDIVVVSGRAPVELELVVPSGHAVKGRVVDPSGASVDYTNVFAFDAKGDPLDPIMPAIAKKDGTFTLPPLAPGRYTIVGARGDKWTDPLVLDVLAQNSDIELSLRDAAHLEIDGEKIGEAWIDVRDASGNCLTAVLDRNLFNGWVTRANYQSTWRHYVSAGEYEVRALDSTGAVIASAKVKVGAGERKRVELER